MAAKVVMVAVPTVLGIASIRVYTVSEAPADGLVTREKLNVYTPLPQLTQLEFVPDSPGSIERGLTAARESILPFAQAVKGACVSVKTGSVNLYHAGEDVYYYLKDPPPGFLPRFGTITMAGLLGMFLARKGSSVKRLAVPMGLMAAGASVCYPAQAVTVCKVTGKKLYTAGQWSSAAVSSLLTSKPQEPVTKEMAASQPQSATVSSPESASASEPSSTSDSSAQSATIPEPEMESAESVPVSEEPVTAVVTEESSVTLTETSPDQATTEINADPTAQSVSAETESALPEELPAPVQNERPPETKQAPEATATEPESTSNAEPETVKAASVESAEVESPPPFEEPHAPKAADEPAVVIESAEPEPVDQPPAAAEEIPAPSLTSPPPPEHPAAGSSKGGSGFKPDPSLMDFGQSSPEDEDLYSTRS